MSEYLENRRAFLGKMAAFAAAGGLLSRPGAALAKGPALTTPEETFLWRMLEGVRMGEPFYGSWYLVDAYPPMAGGVSLTIARGVDGKPLRVDVCRREGGTRAPAFTEHLELYTMDGGGGVKFIEHELVDALQALADKLQDNEAQHLLAEGLLTHAERVAKYPDFMARAATELAPTAP